MTRKIAGIIRENRPTRATRRGSLDRYCRPLQYDGRGQYRDSYDAIYIQDSKGTLRLKPVLL